MTMNVLRLVTLNRWARALAISVPVLAVQTIVPAVMQSLGDQAVVAGIVYAQNEEKKDQKPKRKTKRTQALNNKVYEKLQAAQEAIEAKNTGEAIKILDVLKGRKKPLNDYELANVLNLEAFIYYSQEDYVKALKAYEGIIRLTEAPEGTITQARYSVAQLYFVTEQYAKGVDALLAWFKVTESPTANAYILLSQGYYQIKKNKLALENVNIAIKLYKDKDKIPRENWYGLQRFLYYDKGNYKKVVQILDELLLHYPKKQYWMQLSAMHAELKDEGKQLSAMETAYVQGMLDKEKELINMSYVFLSGEVPYKAAKLLDQGIRDKKIESTSKNLELLGNAWRSAQEIKKAIPVMSKAAAKSEKGELWTRLGNIYLDNDDYSKAVKAVKAGLKKGGVKRPDSAQLVLGMAYYNLKQYKSARKAFTEAKKDKRTKKYAEQWIAFMNKELERQRSLEQEQG
ncbi:tetratricopeptide repeat protein [bacterium AH-315-K03]|nr:tetratricopeptide repeat protein [bacterium AH-315-K03]